MPISFTYRNSSSESSGGYYVVDGTAEYNAEVFSVPEEYTTSAYGTHPVREIASMAFGNNSMINVLYIPESVTTIGAGAFKNCANLTTIEFEKNDVSIASSAFSSGNEERVVSVYNDSYEAGAVGTFFEGYSENVTVNGPFGFTILMELEDGTTYCGISSIDERALDSSGNVTLPRPGTVINGKTIVNVEDSIFDSGVFERINKVKTFKTFVPGNIPEEYLSKFEYVDKVQVITYVWDNDYGGYLNREDVETEFTDLYYSEIDSSFILSHNYEQYVIDGKTNIVLKSEAKVGVNAGDYYYCIYMAENGLRYIFEEDHYNVLYFVMLEGVENTEVTVEASRTREGTEYPVTTIPEGAFSKSDNITKVILPDSITTIGKSAFSTCANLETVVFAENDKIKSIGPHAFWGCTELEDINLTALTALETIGEFAFTNDAALISITLPESIKSIGNYAFSAATGLESINIPDGVTTLGEGVFAGASGLNELSIPSSVTTIGQSAFTAIAAKEIYYDGTVEQWKNMSGGNGTVQTPLSAIVCTDGRLYAQLKCAEADHIYGDWAVKTESDCSGSTIIARTCLICGNEETSTALGTHHFSNGVCTVCGRLEGSSGFTYEKSEVGTSYTITGYTGSSTSIVVPVSYKGEDDLAPLPVSGINLTSDTVTTELTSITLQDDGASLGDISYFQEHDTSITVYTYGEMSTSFASDFMSMERYDTRVVAVMGEGEYEYSLDGTVYRIAGSGSTISIPAGFGSEGSDDYVETSGLASGIFSGRTNMTTLSLPKSVTYVEANVFDGISSLEIRLYAFQQDIIEEVAMGYDGMFTPTYTYYDSISITKYLVKGDSKTLSGPSGYVYGTTYGETEEENFINRTTGDFVKDNYLSLLGELGDDVITKTVDSVEFSYIASGVYLDADFTKAAGEETSKPASLYVKYEFSHDIYTEYENGAEIYMSYNAEDGIKSNIYITKSDEKVLLNSLVPTFEKVDEVLSLTEENGISTRSSEETVKLILEAGTILAGSNEFWYYCTEHDWYESVTIDTSGDETSYYFSNYDDGVRILNFVYD